MFGALSGIVHVDGNGERLGNYLLPAGDTISEPVFVERGNDAAEGDGWLLAVVCARARTAVISPCSMRPTWRQVRLHWSISAIACLTAFTAIGSGRLEAPGARQSPSFRAIAQR